MLNISIHEEHKQFGQCHFIVSSDMEKKGLVNLLIKLDNAFVQNVHESFFK